MIICFNNNFEFYLLVLPWFYKINNCFRHHKIKVDQGKLVDLSRIRRMDFKKLTEEFLTIKDQVSVPKQASKTRNNLLDLVEKYSKGEFLFWKLVKRNDWKSWFFFLLLLTESEKEMDAPRKAIMQKDPDKEDFEAWKKRLLEEWWKLCLKFWS